MSVCGKYVPTFAAASHALPLGMHMSADYPFMMPRIVRVEHGHVTITNGRDEETFKIRETPHGERGVIRQSSTFEKMFGRKPTRFEMAPFKDDRTPAARLSEGTTNG